MTALQLDAFAVAAPSYRAGSYPGARRADTSRIAAAAVAPTLARRQHDVLEAFRALGTATADEVADHLGLTVLATRPRTTELAALGMIEDTGLRRATAAGRPAIVYRLHGGPRSNGRISASEV